MISDMQQSFKGADKRLQLDENKSKTANKRSFKRCMPKTARCEKVLLQCFV